MRFDKKASLRPKRNIRFVHFNNLNPAVSNNLCRFHINLLRAQINLMSKA